MNILDKLKKLKNYHLAWDRYNRKDLIQFRYSIHFIFHICEEYNKNLLWINKHLNINQEETTRSYQRIHGEINKDTAARDIRFCIHLSLLERLDEKQESDFQFDVADRNYFSCFIRCYVSTLQKEKALCNHCHNIVHENKSSFHFHARNKETLKTLLE